MSIYLHNIDLLKDVAKSKDVSFLFLLLTVFFLPLSINISSYCVLLSLLLKFFQVIVLKEKLFATNLLKTSSKIGFIFFTYIIINSIIQTDFMFTINVFEEEFSHFALFFIVPILIPNKSYKVFLANILLISVFFTVVYVFIITLFKNISFNNNAFEDILHLHHTYLATYILLAVHFLLFSLYTKKKLVLDVKVIISIGFLIFSFLVIFLLGSKFSMVVLLLFISSYTLVFLKNNKKSLILLYSILLIIFIIFNKKINTSYKSALDFRIEIWQQSVNSIKQNLFFGDLTMSEKDVLCKMHYLSGKYYLFDSDLNSHNQYLSLLLRFGLVGFIIFIILGLQLFRSNSLKINNSNLINILGFSMVFLSVFYIENILDRHHGIVFFTIFFNYYLVTTTNEKL